MNRPDPYAELLKNKYLMNGSKPVAFLDESYREAGEHANEFPFYIFTAVVVLPKDMEAMRKELEEIAGGHYWHTTEAMSEVGGRERTLEMLKYLADGDEPCVIAKQINIATTEITLEDVRQACLKALSIALTSDQTPWALQTSLIILERRKESLDRNRDEKTFRDAKTAKLVPRQANLFQTSPRYEKLLWLPDVVSSAVRRDIALGEGALYDEIRDQVHFLDPEEI